MKKNKLITFLFISLFITAITCFTNPVDASTQNGWVQNSSGNWEYYDHAGYPLTYTWLKDKGEWYFFDENGEMLSNSFGHYGNYYFYSNGAMASNRWIEVDNMWYYALSSGQLVISDWHKVGNKWYYFDYDGEMQTSRIIDNYYVDASGAMISNKWEKYGDGWVYATNNGQLLTNTWKKSGNDWYYFDYWGSTYQDRVVLINNVLYAFDKNSKMVPIKPGWIKFDESWYYFDKNGKPVEYQWLKSGNDWYYIDRDGRAFTDTIYSNTENAKNDFYAFDKSAKMVKNGWYNPYNQKGWWVFAQSNGRLLTNQWKKSGDKWYYFGPNATTLNNTVEYINGKPYVFNENGELATSGSVEISRYLDNTYVNALVFPDKNGVALSNQWKQYNNKWYYLNHRGHAEKSIFIELDGKTYFLKDDSTMAKNETLYFDSMFYTFNGSGHLINQSTEWE